MLIHLNPADGSPIYLQLIQQIRRLIVSGRLRPGQELPTIRALAERLVINPNTVARAYRELERLELVVKNSTIGTFVADRVPTASPLEQIAPQVDALLNVAEEKLLPITSVTDFVQQRYQERLAPRHGDPS
jgi:GntR family transcriptional regulator